MTTTRARVMLTSARGEALRGVDVRRRIPLLLAAVVLTLGLGGTAMSAEQRTAALGWEGVAEFAAATVDNAMAASVHQGSASGGVSLPALFLHPQSRGRASVSFPAASVPVKQGDLVFFLGYAGLRDGVGWDDEEHVPDGARFYVSSGGEQLAAAMVDAPGWVPMAVKLSGPAQAKGALEVTMGLQTDSGPNERSDYDWALFGAPLVVALDGRPIGPDAAIEGADGVLVAQTDGDAGSLIVEGLDAEGEVIEGVQAVQEVQQGTTMPFVRFDFADREAAVQWRWRVEGCVASEAWGGSWTPQPWITHVGPAQAVTFEDEPVRVRVGIMNKGMGTLLPVHGCAIECNGQTKALERLGPGETVSLEFDLGVSEESQFALRAHAQCGAWQSTVRDGVTLWPELPPLPAERPNRAEILQLGEDYFALQNPRCRWVIWEGAPGIGALVYVWSEGKWELSGSVSPWIRFVLDRTGSGTKTFEISTEEGDGCVRLEASAGIAATRCSLSAELPDDSPAMRIDVRLSPVEGGKLAALRGPAVHAGDRATGVGKGVAIFPGLEYLNLEERSSSTRDLAPPLNERWVPHKFKITVPLMMVETREGGPVLGIAWDAAQKWHQDSTSPGACFASPDFITHQDNHLMQLFLPSVPDYVLEGARLSEEPVALDPNEPWAMTQYIIAGQPSKDATEALEWFDEIIGYPEAEDWPRSVEDELALCRHGFMQSVWDEESGKSRHTVDRGNENAPGFAALLLMDARATAPEDQKQALLDRVERIADTTMGEQGEAGLSSRSCCHIMGWEFPYHFGHLPGALQGMRAQAYSSLTRQEDNGGWGFYADERRSALGERGTQTLGICARNAYTLAKYAAVSGDPKVFEGMNKALLRLREFTVPRGAQEWECPILQPDVLGSAYAVRAYAWARMVTGDESWLEDARYWARTGLPFQYSWDDGGHPGMRYASIPVFGSTFFNHSWIGLPVQWCGLVYAYGLQELMRFDNNDLWRRQVEGIVASATHQQWPMDGGELAGTYPDSFGNWFTQRRPAHINPEDIMLNVLAMEGFDPGLRSLSIPTEGGSFHVTGPGSVEGKARGAGLDVTLKYLPDEIAYLTIAPVGLGADVRVTCNGVELGQQDDLAAGAVGWTYDEDLHILVVGVKCDKQASAGLTLSGVACVRPEAVPSRQQWEFDEGTQGWQPGNACNIAWEAGALRMATTGDDPYALAGPAEIDAGTHKKLAMRVRLTAGEQLGLFWRANISPSWGEDKHVDIFVPPDGQWHEVEFDLSDQSLWAGKVVQIRLDIEPPDVAPGAILEVDWIRPG